MVAFLRDSDDILLYHTASDGLSPRIFALSIIKFDEVQAVDIAPSVLLGVEYVAQRFLKDRTRIRQPAHAEIRFAQVVETNRIVQVALLALMACLHAYRADCLAQSADPAL